ncbi:uncharacterized protein MAM_07227 [Metarhizium album ARSEF 1941]|uniref:Integral membrane protein n=1 Tax=Metarhizium album (strain ARSEF 1941) TaxID=1081103 RepID=A0A0B2WPT4_METAS|nr:uncharacterized protein MAM_07227 [Metarhizium album ARSEF 1941]KHN95000.1 integral membrane protein [Metarhizium album ARSEF 1941]
MSQDSTEVMRRAIVELVNLPNCAANCYARLATANNTYSCSTVSNRASLEKCLLHACPLPEAISARNTTEIACHTPARNISSPFLVINIVLGIVTAGVICLRLGYRLFFSRKNGRLDFDDGLILLASPVALASLTTMLAGLWKHGIGRDVWGIQSEQLVTFGLYLYVMEMLYLSLLALVKLTLSLFYLEIFPSPTIRKLLWATVVFHICFGLAFVFKTTFQCTPLNYSWFRYDAAHASTTHGHCVNINASAWANAIGNVATDFWLIGIPLSQLHKLRLHWKKKIGASIMFMTGLLYVCPMLSVESLTRSEMPRPSRAWILSNAFFQLGTSWLTILPACSVTLFSILRLNTLAKYANSTNPTYDQYPVTLWSAIEVNIGLICTCLPSIRLVLLRIWPRVFGMTTANSSTGNSATGNSQKTSNRSMSRYSNKTPANNRQYELDAAAILDETKDAAGNVSRSDWGNDPEGGHEDGVQLGHGTAARNAWAWSRGQGVYQGEDLPVYLEEAQRVKSQL